MKNFIITALGIMIILLACSEKSDDSSTSPEQNNPAELFLTADNPEILPGGNSTAVYATLVDEIGDTLGEGYNISFDITSAPSHEGAESPSFSYPASDDSMLYFVTATTNANGQAIVELYSGTYPGEITLQASNENNTDIQSSDLVILITEELINSIEISADTAELNVAYGIDSTIINAQAFDQSGIEIGAGYHITLELINESPEASFETRSNPPLESYTAVTNNTGQVSVPLFIFTQSGQITIRAKSTYYETVATEQQLLYIQPGPVHHIDIHSDITDPDASSESITARFTADVWDVYNNPVAPFTAVYFGLIPDTIGYVYGFAYTGGYLDPDDPSDTVGVMGQAESWLSYSCTNTFDTLRIIANSDEIADTSAPFPLPIFEGNISIDANPGELTIAVNDSGYSDITAELRDGLGCPIQNGFILFSITECGGFAPDAQLIDTTDIDGLAFTTFGIYYDDITPPSCEAIVNARLRDYPDIEGEVSIICLVEQ